MGFLNFFKKRTTPSSESHFSEEGQLSYTPECINNLAPDEVFVFGSNLRGWHQGGAAKHAHRYFGAVWGQGVGLQGQSYAIPTMQGDIDTIQPYVDDFISFAREHPEKRFLVTPIGCGIAGFSPAQIAPLFSSAIEVANIILPYEFVQIIKKRNNK